MLSFIKYICSGRAYLLFCGEGTPPAHLVPLVCDATRGAGASQLLAFEARAEADATLACFLSDGGRTPPDHGAVCCAAKYLYDFARVNRTQICLSTDTGTKRIQLESYGGVARDATLDLGYPTLDGAAIPCCYPRLTRARPVILGGNAYSLTCLRVGTPFACLMGDTAPARASLTPLTRDFPAGVAVLYTRELQGARLVGEMLLSLPSPPDGAASACALAIAGAISGNLPFSTPISAEIGDERHTVTLSPRLAMSLTLYPREVLRLTLDEEELALI